VKTVSAVVPTTFRKLACRILLSHFPHSFRWMRLAQRIGPFQSLGYGPFSQRAGGLVPPASGDLLLGRQSCLLLRHNILDFESKGGAKPTPAP